MQGSTKFYDNHCASYIIIFLGPKLSIETNISKNICFHKDKSFWHIFPRIIECDKLKEHFIRVRKIFWQIVWKL